MNILLLLGHNNANYTTQHVRHGDSDEEDDDGAAQPAAGAAQPQPAAGGALVGGAQPQAVAEAVEQVDLDGAGQFASYELLDGQSDSSELLNAQWYNELEAFNEDASGDAESDSAELPEEAQEPGEG